MSVVKFAKIGILPLIKPNVRYSNIPCGPVNGWHYKILVLAIC
jgi:hypothetical protein